MSYSYQTFDNIFDIESLANFFLDSHYFVSQQRIEIFYLSRIPHLKNFQNQLSSGETIADYIKERIINYISGFKSNSALKIRFYNLLNFNNFKKYLKLFGVTPNAPAALGYLNSKGQILPPSIHSINKYSNGQSMSLWHHTQPISVYQYDRELLKSGSQYCQISDAYNLLFKYYSDKVTDPDFNPHRYGNGIMIGYNSDNYDLTILAGWLARLIRVPGVLRALNQDRKNWPQNLRTNERIHLAWLLNPQSIRQFNDYLFSLTCHHRSMPEALMTAPVDHHFMSRFQNPAWYIRKGWLQTNRFLDILHLNHRISLKRVEAMTGMQLNESVYVSSKRDVITNLRQLADFLAYNINDVNATRKAFEMPVYQDALKLRRLLLRKFPALTYSFDHHKVKRQQATAQDVLVAPDNLRFTRLTDDSSSAQFIINTIAPYHALKDIPGVDYSYPDPRVLRLLKRKYPQRNLIDHPVDILDQTMQWAGKQDHKYHTKGRITKSLMPIYNTYKQLEYCNVNRDLCTVQHHQLISLDRSLLDPRGNLHQIGPYVNLNTVMHRYNTNAAYIKSNGQPSSCLVAFGTGGIHGLEIRQSRFLKEIHQYKKRLKIQKQIQKIFGSDNRGAAAAKWKNVINLRGKLVKAQPYLKSGSTVKKAAWRHFKFPRLFKKIKRSGRYILKNEYNYISVGSCQHEDFSGYYPLLISRLGAFWPRDEKTDLYRHLYIERLHLKSQLNRYTKNSSSWDKINLRQKLRKLLLNSASGAGSANFTNHLRMNNRIVSMRIIGQLFAWRIGEAETLAGGRVVSTNTDGMYVMNLSPKVNNQILFKNVREMLLNIAPVPLARLVSKDANNRVEVEEHHHHNILTEAKGGTLTSWQGPGPTNNLSHPAVIDWVLAHYLAYYHGNPSNHPFDNKMALRYLGQMRANLLKPAKAFLALKMFQWVTAVSRWKHRFLFLQIYQQCGHNYRLKDFKKLGKINRLFLIKSQTVGQFLKIAKVQKANWYRFNNDAAYQDKLIGLVESNLNQHVGKIVKYPDMPKDQNVYVDGHNLRLFPVTKRRFLYHHLDLEAYLQIVKAKFNSSWSNLVK